jgi:hypothetical protein
MRLLQFDPSLVPNGGLEIYSGIGTLVKNNRKDAAGRAFHNFCLLQAGLIGAATHSHIIYSSEFNDNSPFWQVYHLLPRLSFMQSVKRPRRPTERKNGPMTMTLTPPAIIAAKMTMPKKRKGMRISYYATGRPCDVSCLSKSTAVPHKFALVATCGDNLASDEHLSCQDGGPQLIRD